MSQVEFTIVECVEPGALVEVGHFLKQEWAALDRERWGNESPQWHKTCHWLRSEHDGQTVGAARFYFRGGVAHLSEIVVGQSWRGQGIGGRLMACFEEMARRAGCHKLSLRTLEGSPSVRFYQRLGYEVEGKLIRHYHQLTFLQLCKFLT